VLHSQQMDNYHIAPTGNGFQVVESRADALHRFVQSYRQLAQLPPPHLRLTIGSLKRHRAPLPSSASGDISW